MTFLSFAEIHEVMGSYQFSNYRNSGIAKKKKFHIVCQRKMHAVKNYTLLEIGAVCPCRVVPPPSPNMKTISDIFVNLLHLASSKYELYVHTAAM